MQERGKTVRHPRDRVPENGETIQSAADAANCPLIIRTTASGDGEPEWVRAGHNPASFSFSSDEGRRMKYSTLIRCNCDVVLENSPGPFYPLAIPYTAIGAIVVSISRLWPFFPTLILFVCRIDT